MTTLDQPAPARSRYILNYDALVNSLLFVLVSLGSFTFIEPSPYDVTLIAVLGVWLFSGFRIHKSVLPIAALSVIGAGAAYLAMIPWFHAEESFTYWAHSIYLFITLVFFAIVFGEDSARRAELCMRGFMVSCVLAATLGIIGWFDIGGTAVLFSPENRAMGPFKDPNVLGSYLVAGHIYLLQRLLLGTANGWFAKLTTIATMLLLLFAVFLSFSRGAWAVAVLSSLLLSAVTFFTADNAKARARLIVIFSVVAGLAVVALLVALSVEQVRDMFLQRASFEHSYDLGETGRFGNQLRSIPLLLDRPFGMGPLRFRTFFGLDPHNSYIGNFANNGWLGGFVFLLMIGLTLFIGARLSVKRSPFQRVGQAFTITVLMFFLQGMQIDIDHWRFVYLFMGALWGLEAGQQRWVARQQLADGAVVAAPG